MTPTKNCDPSGRTAHQRRKPEPFRRVVTIAAGSGLLAVIMSGLLMLNRPDRDRSVRAAVGGTIPADQPNQDGQQDGPPTKLDGPPRTAIAHRELKALLSKELNLTGTMRPENVSDQFGLDTQHYHRWTADVRLENGSPTPVALGPDLLMIEVSGDGTEYGGFSVFGVEPDIVSPASYGLDTNYELAGQRINKGGGRYTISFFGWQGESFGVALREKAWELKRDFPQHTWLRQPATVCLVLPELRVESAGAVHRFRLLANFAKEKEGEPWAVCQQRLIALEPGSLKEILADPGSNLMMKVLAANWLAECCPMEAAAPLAKAALPLHEGQLLASCLGLLTKLSDGGLEQHSLALLQDDESPNGIRSLSAEYLGAVHHGPALKPLIAATDDRDPVVARGAIRGLGAFGGPRAVQALAAILRDGKRRDDQREAADSLVRTRDPAALRMLQDEVNGGSETALRAMAEAGLPETFEFFVSMAEKVEKPERRDLVALGCKSTGGDKALPVLLKMIERAEPLDEHSHGDGLVDALAEMDKPEATSKLVELATAGNLRAALALARSQNDTVQRPLTRLATEGNGAVMRVALGALADRWPDQNVAAFTGALSSSSADVVEIGIRGIHQSKTPLAMQLLIPLMEHQAKDVRRSAAWAVRDLPPRDHAAAVSGIFLRSKDPTVLSVCAELLIAANWADRAAIPELGKKLAAVEDSNRYALVRVLRHLSGNAMGPEDINEWYQDRDGWSAKWVEWANRKQPQDDAKHRS